MLKKLQSEPALAGAILSLIGAIIGLFIHNPALAAALGGVFAAFLGVRQVVVPVTTAATQITQAATDTATKVVQDLDQTTVGTVGEITNAASSIINNAVNTLGKG